MAVQDGQRANAQNFNNAFVSRTSNSAMSSQLSLSNTDAASGDSITNVQEEINQMTFKTYGSQSLSDGGTINFSSYKGMQYRRVEGASGNVTLSTTPFGTVDSATRDGTLVRVVLVNATYSVSFTHNDAANGCLLNGNTTLSAKGDCITFQWDSFMSRFVEVGRNF